MIYNQCDHGMFLIGRIQHSSISLHRHAYATGRRRGLTVPDSNVKNPDHISFSTDKTEHLYSERKDLARSRVETMPPSSTSKSLRSTCGACRPRSSRFNDARVFFFCSVQASVCVVWMHAQQVIYTQEDILYTHNIFMPKIIAA